MSAREFLRERKTKLDEVLYSDIDAYAASEVARETAELRAKVERVCGLGIDGIQNLQRELTSYKTVAGVLAEAIRKADIVLGNAYGMPSETGVRDVLLTALAEYAKLELYETALKDARAVLIEWGADPKALECSQIDAALRGEK